jgi:hypothetical protein
MNYDIQHPGQYYLNNCNMDFLKLEYLDRDREHAFRLLLQSMLASIHCHANNHGLWNMILFHTLQRVTP